MKVAQNILMMNAKLKGAPTLCLSCLPPFHVGSHNVYDVDRIAPAISRSLNRTPAVDLAVDEKYFVIKLELLRCCANIRDMIK